MKRTNIELYENLVDEAMRFTHLRTKKELVHFALQELVRKERRKSLLEFEGKLKWQGNLNRMRKSRT